MELEAPPNPLVLALNAVLALSLPREQEQEAQGPCTLYIQWGELYTVQCGLRDRLLGIAGDRRTQLVVIS